MTSIRTSSADHTVVLLGAGASKGSEKDLPTMQGFFGPTLDDLSSELRSFLFWFYGHENLDQYNVEDVLSYLDITHARAPKWIDAASGGAPPGVTVPRYEVLLGYIATRLEVSGPSCLRHRRLIERLDPRDTILTLNYDLVCDEALSDLEKNRDSGVVGDRLWKLPSLLGTVPVGTGVYPFGEPVALMPIETLSGFYIKLHGSLNWLHCPNSLCPNVSRYYIVTDEGRVEGQAVGRPCRRCGNLLKMFVVPPIATKSIEHEGRLAFLWSLALSALANAKKIIIVGVSFTPSDQELRWLIRQSRALSSFPVSLDLVNPNESHRSEALALVTRPAEVKHFKTLEDYLEDRQVPP